MLVKSPQAAIADAAEALREVFAHKREGGFPAQQPSSLSEIVASEEIGEGESAVMIPLLLDSGRTVRAKVSRDAALLDAIDAVAKERGLSRSAFLASAARERIMTGHSGVPPDGARLLGERVGVEASPGSSRLAPRRFCACRRPRKRLFARDASRARVHFARENLMRARSSAG
jgi:hypothetical protein